MDEIGFWAPIAPNRWRWVSRLAQTPVPRSNLPAPHIISDIMEPTEQVDGKFYTSKSQFRAVGRAHGLTEVGNEKLGPKRRDTVVRRREHRAARHAALQMAAEQYKAGRRVRSDR